MFPPELVDRVVAEAGRTERRQRLLRSWSTRMSSQIQCSRLIKARNDYPDRAAIARSSTDGKASPNVVHHQIPDPGSTMRTIPSIANQSV